MTGPLDALQGLLDVSMSYLALAASGWLTAKAVPEIAHAIYDTRGVVREISDRREQVARAKEMLGITGPGRFLYRHDNHHPLYGPGLGLHPDNQAALIAAGGAQYLRAMRSGHAEIVDSVWGSLHENLVLIGSPTSEGVSRLVFGYEARDGRSDELIRRTDAPLDLPFTMTLDRGDMAIGSTARRIVAGRGDVARPNWRITGPHGTYVPEVDSDGWLQTDYLIVTRMPNFLTPAGLEQGRHIVSLAGAHGTGTRAVDRLVSDRSLLRKLGDSSVGRGRTPFQALFRVSGMQHHPRRGSRATRIEIVDEPISLTQRFETWTAAYEAVRPALAKWRAPKTKLDDETFTMKER